VGSCAGEQLIPVRLSTFAISTHNRRRHIIAAVVIIMDNRKSRAKWPKSRRFFEKIAKIKEESQQKTRRKRGDKSVLIHKFKVPIGLVIY